MDTDNTNDSPDGLDKWEARRAAEDAARLDYNNSLAEQARSASEINSWQASRCSEEFVTYGDRMHLARDFVVALIGDTQDMRDDRAKVRGAIDMADELIARLGPRPECYQPFAPKAQQTEEV